MVNIRPLSEAEAASLASLAARERDFAVFRTILTRTRNDVRDALETVRDHDDILRLQGQAKLISELERLFQNLPR
jgi:hypothetical protein